MKNRLPIIILLSLLTLTVSAQVNIRSVENYTVEDGLSQNTVYTILQGGNGLIWLGTERNVNKYDGYDLTPVYLLNKKNINSQFSTIYDITEDENGNIWFGTINNAAMLNINTEEIIELKEHLDKENPEELGAVLTVKHDSKGNTWLGTFGKGLFKIEAEFDSINHYSNSPDSLTDSSLDYIRDIYEDENGSLWLATYGGLVKFDTVSETFENIFYLQEDESFKHTTVNKIIKYGNRFILPTNYKGILTYNTVANVLTELNAEINKTLSRYNVRDMGLDDKGHLWCAVYNYGVVVIDPQTWNMHNLNSIIGNAEELGLKNPLSLCIDNTGIVWIGTEYNGLIKLVLGNKTIGTINNKTYPAIKSEFVLTAAEDTNGKVWLSTRSGLYKIDRADNSITNLKIAEDIGSGSPRIYNIEMAYGKAWLSLANKLIEHTLTGKEYKIHEVDSERSITEILPLEDDELLLATAAGELIFYNTASGNKKSFYIGGNKAASPAITNCRRMGNIIWIATADGLYKYNFNSQKNEAEKVELDLAVDYIISLTATDDNRLWLGTYGDGLLCYDPGNNELTHINRLTTFPDNVAYGVLSDEENNIWLSSNKGIFKYYPETNTLKVFNTDDGLQGYEFNGNAYSKAEDGEMFFGGVNGLNYFYPSEIEQNNARPQTIITKAILHDSTIAVNIIDNNDEHEFKHTDNSLSFEFSSLDYNNPAKNSYEYMLEGSEEKWMPIGTKRYATFANLAPGRYKFMVKGSNNDQVYDTTAASFSFAISPPFWAEWWFRLGVILLLLSLGYLYYRSRIIAQQNQMLEIERIRRRIADDFHDDLGHKLTRISLYTELMKNNGNVSNDQNAYLNKISDAANSLFYETKDFIWSLDPDNDTIYDLLVYLKDFGDDFFSKTGIAFKVDEISESFKSHRLPMKWKREIILIFKEAMNNVLKHSEANTAELKAEYSNSQLQITLIDNGSGFDQKDDNNSGRGLESIRKRTKVINGSLSIASGKQGTAIRLNINLTKVDK